MSLAQAVNSFSAICTAACAHAYFPLFACYLTLAPTRHMLCDTCQYTPDGHMTKSYPSLPGPTVTCFLLHHPRACSRATVYGVPWCCAPGCAPSRLLCAASACGERSATWYSVHRYER